MDNVIHVDFRATKHRDQAQESRDQVISQLVSIAADLGDDLREVELKAGRLYDLAFEIAREDRQFTVQLQMQSEFEGLTDAQRNAVNEAIRETALQALDYAKVAACKRLMSAGTALVTSVLARIERPKS